MAKIKRNQGPRTQIKKAISTILEKVKKENEGSHYSSRGLSLEGYTGGYLDALTDILLVLNGVNPKRRDYWDNWNN